MFHKSLIKSYILFFLLHSSSVQPLRRKLQLIIAVIEESNSSLPIFGQGRHPLEQNRNNSQVQICSCWQRLKIHFGLHKLFGCLSFLFNHFLQNKSIAKLYCLFQNHASNQQSKNANELMLHSSWKVH